MMPKFCITGLLLVLLTAVTFAGAQEQAPRLVGAVMCENIENFKPVNPTVVFSVSQGEAYCFTSFDPVYEKSVIFHKWYKKDKLIFTMKLTLSPPSWSSFSRIQIREADRGPWRVEICDPDGNVMQTLRFSMSD